MNKKTTKLVSIAAAAAFVSVPVATIGAGQAVADTPSPITWILDKIGETGSSNPALPSATLASTPWQTTGAVDQDGKPLALTDKNVQNYVGYAYYKVDGSFTMYNLDDTPKMQGDWKLTPDGKTRTITAKDETGKVKFTRSSPIETLTATEFTYRTYPEQNNQSVYVDIVHTPTTHKAPMSAPSSTAHPMTSGSMSPSSMAPHSTPEAPGSR